MDHLRAEETLAHLAECAHAHAGRELLQLAWIEPEEAQREYTGTILDMADELTARTIFHRAFDDATPDEHVLSGRCFVDRIKPCFVVVAQRQVQHQIEQA